MSCRSIAGQHVHFITGKLAENGLRKVVVDLATKIDFDYTIQVMPITVAALLTPSWIAKRLELPESATLCLLPGYCDGDLSPLAASHQVEYVVGPRDYRELPVFFGSSGRKDDYGDYSIEIIAEINHAPRLPLNEILAPAKRMHDDGADIIDVGCDPGTTWTGVKQCVKELKENGHRVSIDSFNSKEIDAAVNAGAELVLSVNSSNSDAALNWDVEVVLIPDQIETLMGLDQLIERFSQRQRPFRIDPILEPIGCGFAASLNRYLEVRRRYPETAMLMGIGNLTELTDCDSAGINLLLMGICQELQIGSILTTEVINWARTSVRECDIARRLVYYSVTNGTVPKHVTNDLVRLRDAKLLSHGEEALAALHSQLKDNNFRIFAEGGLLRLMNGDVLLTGKDPFELFEQLLATAPSNLDNSHAFYLGYEFAKAVTAMTLGKNYRQDEALDWGDLTRPETRHRSRVHRRQDTP